MKLFKRAIWILALALSCSGSANAADIAERVKIDALALPLVDQGWVAGLSIGLTSEKETQFIAYGYTADAGSPAPNEKTEFEIGSVTKVFTG
ncbi:MAG TPA: hypothetical protein VL175_18760, partial [Pirellulales bacterium]|nr:hypothetical protein [Pirellulales bacterium]